jgi:hypothetical protein
MHDSELKIERIKQVTRQLDVDETAIFKGAQNSAICISPLRDFHAGIVGYDPDQQILFGKYTSKNLKEEIDEFEQRLRDNGISVDNSKKILLDAVTGRQRFDFLGVMFHFGEYSIRHITDYARLYR